MTTTSDEAAVRALYSQILGGWNIRSGEALAAPFATDGEVVGFDGSQVTGQAAIAEEMQRIFDDHETAAYVGKVRAVRILAPGAALLTAVAGMVPPGADDIKPEQNSVQTVVAAHRDGQWRVVLFQNTPAQYHGRPEAVRELTEELREVLRATAS